MQLSKFEYSIYQNWTKEFCHVCKQVGTRVASQATKLIVNCPSGWSLYLSLPLWVDHQSQHHSNRETGTAMQCTTTLSAFQGTFPHLRSTTWLGDGARAARSASGSEALASQLLFLKTRLLDIVSDSPSYTSFSCSWCCSGCCSETM